MFDDIGYYDPAEIFTWGSTDRMSTQDWESLLFEKITHIVKDDDDTRDFSYKQDIVPDLLANGFRSPLAVQIRPDCIMHSNGHHRLAIALLAGYNEIPYMHFWVDPAKHMWPQFKPIFEITEPPIGSQPIYFEPPEIRRPRTIAGYKLADIL